MSVSEKAELRADMARRRVRAFEDVDPTPALAALEEALAGAEAPVSFYWPIRTELDPRPVMQRLEARGVPVSLPVTHGRNAPLSFRRWTPETEMETDGFGVSVPSAKEMLTPATLVVPLLGFDRRGHRLGYGAGHYDRTLFGLRAAGPVLAIGFAFSAQELDEPMPAEPTDQALDLIVTENGAFTPGDD